MKNKPECVFCKIVAGEIPATKVYESENTLAFLDITPVNFGHTLVIPKKHYENLHETPEETVCELMAAVKKIADAIKISIKADGINIGMNNGTAAGQIVPHSHIHIMPRFTNDGYELWRSDKKYSNDEMEGTAEKIKKNL